MPIIHTVTVAGWLGSDAGTGKLAMDEEEMGWGLLGREKPMLGRCGDGAKEDGEERVDNRVMSNSAR